MTIVRPTRRQITRLRTLGVGPFLEVGVAEQPVELGDHVAVHVFEVHVAIAYTVAILVNRRPSVETVQFANST